MSEFVRACTFYFIKCLSYIFKFCLIGSTLFSKSNFIKVNSSIMILTGMKILNLIVK